MLAPDFTLSRRRDHAWLRALKRGIARFAMPALFGSAAPILLVGGWYAAAWLWVAVHPAVAVLVGLIALADAAFALCGAMLLLTEGDE